MAKEVEAHLPDGRVVTVQGVPDDLSPDDFKSQFRQRHPEYFGSTATPSGETLPTRQLESGYSSPGLATLFGQKEQPPAKAAPTEPDTVLGGIGRRAKETITGLGQTFDPREALSALWGHGDIAEAIANTPAYRMAHGLVESEKQAGPQALQQFKEAGQISDPVAKSLKYGQSAVTGLSMLDPLATPSVSNINALEAQGRPREAAGQGIADLATFAVGKGLEHADTGIFQQGLAATSHDILNRSANQLKAKLWDAHGKVGQRVGQLKNDIAAADYQSGEPSIPVADLWSQVQDIADRYKATGKDTPKFAAAADAVSQRGPYLTWKELDDLKQEIDPLWRKSAEGSRDSGATNELRDTINKKLAQRASDIDRGDQFKAYNKLWSTLKGYEEDGALGKILTAENGASVMDVLKDSANKAELARTIDSLSNFGLPKDTLSNFTDTHEPLHNYVKDVEKKGFGKIKVILKHPVVGTAGAIAGTGVGSLVGEPHIGGIVGAVGSAGLADRIAAARAVSKLGKPSLEGEMTEAAKVQPVGTGERPTAPPPKPGAVNRDELVQAMKGLGYSKQESASRALQGMTDFPNDFSKALNRAMQGPAAPAAKAEAIKQTKTQTIKPVSGGAPPTISVPPTETRSIVRPGPKTIPANVPPKTAEMIQQIRKMEQAKIGTAKSAKPREAFDQAKAEWQQENPGKNVNKHLDEVKRRAANLSKGK